MKDQGLVGGHDEVGVFCSGGLLSELEHSATEVRVRALTLGN
jgi:hypothetical protein